MSPKVLVLNDASSQSPDYLRACATPVVNTRKRGIRKKGRKGREGRRKREEILYKTK